MLSVQIQDSFLEKWTYLHLALGKNSFDLYDF